MGNRPVTRAYLKGYRLAFMGHSEQHKGSMVNLVPEPGRMVPGALYELDEVMIHYLDRAEACEKGVYQRLEVEVEKDDGEKVKADGYRLAEPNPVFGKPNLGYQTQVKQGYKEWGLPEEIFEEALKWSAENAPQK